MDERNTALMFVLVLCVCGALLYLDWRRQGEIEYLHDRFDALNDAADAAMSRLRGDEPAPAELIEREVTR